MWKSMARYPPPERHRAMPGSGASSGESVGRLSTGERASEDIILFSFLPRDREQIGRKSGPAEELAYALFHRMLFSAIIPLTKRFTHVEDSLREPLALLLVVYPPASRDPTLTSITNGSTRQ